MRKGRFASYSPKVTALYFINDHEITSTTLKIRVEKLFGRGKAHNSSILMHIVAYTEYKFFDFPFLAVRALAVRGAFTRG